MQTSILEEVKQDIRFSLRSLLRSRSFAASAILVVALGIGATAAIFSAVNSYFFRPLPFSDPDNLVMLYETNPEFEWTHADAAPANVLDWRERVGAFQDVAAYSMFTNPAVFLRDGQPDLVAGIGVTGNFFSVLGTRPVMGRGFRFDETWAGEDEVVVLSHGLWVSHFGASPDAVGTVIELNGSALEIIGVAPPEFRFPTDDAQFWFPIGWSREARDQVWFRRAHFVKAVARLAPYASLGTADDEFQAVVRRIQHEYPETNRVMGAGMMPLRDFLTREIHTPLMILLASAGLLLLLACVNVANLTLLRADDRRREVALRQALGAGRSRVMRLMITESLTIGLLGGLVGMPLGWLGVRSMTHLTRVGIDGATSLALDGRVVAFTAGVAVLCGVLFGLLPAVRAGGAQMGETLRDGARGTARARGFGTGNALVAVEVALALLLVTGAGLTIRSFWLLREVDPGFQTQGVLALQFTVPSDRYESRDEVLSFYDAFSSALEGRPGIERVGIVGQLPLAGTSWSSQFQAEGWPPDRIGFEILHRRADPGYFEALQIPLVDGRMFDGSHGPEGPFVVLINETLAREHFPGQSPIGQRIAYDRAATPESTWYEIIGIVGDQNQISPGIPVKAEAFENSAQDWDRSNWIVVRASVDALVAVPTVRNVLAEIDPLIPIASIRPLREVWSRSMSQERFVLALLGAFGALALLLATVGVYTVSAQAARKRSHELGIRIALGAGRVDVISLVVGRTLWVVGFGVASGLLASLVMSRALRSQLYAIGPTDPTTLATVVLGLTIIVVLASYVPARKATRIDPVKSLRGE